jgi:flagellar assembly factor FliW
LLSSAFQNYNNDWDDAFPDHEDKFRWWAIYTQNVFVIFASVMLLNLVIARMSATHDAINEKSFEQWQFRRALSAKGYLLINERCPFNMLAPPFNLLPIVVAFLIDYPIMFLYVKPHLKTPEGAKGMKGVTCWSGWACDALIGVCGSIVCPFVELLIYLYRSLTGVGSNLYELFVFCCCFPLSYPFYVISLLMEALHERTKLEVKLVSRLDSRLKQNYEYKIVYNEIESPLKITNDNRYSVLSIKFIRATMRQLAENSSPIVQVVVQNVGDCTKDFFIEDRTKGTVLFSKSLIQIPLKQLNMANNLNMRLILMDKNEITGDIRVVASKLIPEQEVKLWIANGRYEGPIDFDKNKENSVQVVIKSDIYEDDVNEWEGILHEAVKNKAIRRNSVCNNELL